MLAPANYCFYLCFFVCLQLVKMLHGALLKGDFKSKMLDPLLGFDLGGLTTLVLKDESTRKQNVAMYRMYSQFKGGILVSCIV